MEKILTISMAAYNVGKYLPEVLPTFLESSILSDIEILIIDDGSKDHTAEIAAAFERDYSETIRLISKENGGHGSTINTGIACAKGKYFKVIDSDDWVDTTAFCRYVEKLKKRDEDLIISPYNTVDDATGAIIGTFTFDDVLCENRTYGLDSLKSVQLFMHAMAFKTEILRKVKPISEHCFYVDNEYILYPLPYVNTLAYIHEPIYQYRLGRAGQSVQVSSQIKNRAMHLQVTKNIIALYKVKWINEKARVLIEKKLMELCETQMFVYYSMPVSGKTKQEADAFIQYIRKEIPELCRRIQRKDIRILVMTNGKLYWPTALVYHLKMLCVKSGSENRNE